jgi:hypothetical protein
MNRLPALVFVAALLLCACNASTPAGDTGLYLPTAGSEAMMQALFRGPLIVRNECVLAGDPGDYILPI